MNFWLSERNKVDLGNETINIMVVFLLKCLYGRAYIAKSTLTFMIYKVSVQNKALNLATKFDFTVITLNKFKYSLHLVGN